MTKPDHKDRISLSELKTEWNKIKSAVGQITAGHFNSQKYNFYMKKNTLLTGPDSVTKLQK